MMCPFFTIATATPGTSNVRSTRSTYASKPASGLLPRCAPRGAAPAEAIVASRKVARQFIDVTERGAEGAARARRYWSGAGGAPAHSTIARATRRFGHERHHSIWHGRRHGHGR